MLTEELQKELLFATKINEKVLQEIRKNKWLNIWVPKEYKGLGCSFSEGLQILNQLATVDGSLGWFVTLCSGANYFSRNLQPATAKKLFEKENICFGGSGMIGGTAEKIDHKYLINGHWHYATGAPYLSHFTLNAQIVENGKALTQENGEPVFKSFVVEASQVKLIPTWKTMGMIATDSYSFDIENKLVSEDYSFIYNEYFSDTPIDRLDFQVFADFTLLVNYLGVAKHFMETSLNIKAINQINTDLDYIDLKTNEVLALAKQADVFLSTQSKLTDSFIEKIHLLGEEIVTTLTTKIVKIYPLLGVRAAKTNEEINHIFRDFFTITQHQNFRNKY